MQPHTTLTLTALAALLALAPASRADVIRVGNIDRTVAITDIRDGLVLYRARGAEREAALDTITSIQLTKYPAFAKAVAKTGAEPAQAADELGKLLKSVREPYLKPLILIRRAEALDRAGRFVEALNDYAAALALDDSAYYIDRAPSRLPADAARRAAARKAVERLLTEQDSPAVTERLRALLAEFDQAPAEKPQAQTTEPEPKPKPEPKADDAGQAPRLEEIEGYSKSTQQQIANLVAAKKYPQAVARIDRAIAAPKAPLADLYYQRGLAQAAMKQDAPAALSFLRTASLFPEHKLADDALFQAGAALERAGKGDIARRVWAIGLRRTKDPALAAKFRSMLEPTPVP